MREKNSKSGQMEKPKTKTIHQTWLIPAKPVEVYDALINSRKHAGFTGAGATGNARVGGKFTAWDGYISGKHLVLERARRIVQEWATTEWPEGYAPSRLEFKFSAKGKGTKVNLLHSNVPAEQVDSYRQGWLDYYCRPLKEHFLKRIVSLKK